jgi:hypothetical protein
VNRGEITIALLRCKRERSALLEALKDIAEYWNGRDNQTAMSDALDHIVEVAIKAIALAEQENEQKAKLA